MPFAEALMAVVLAEKKEIPVSRRNGGAALTWCAATGIGFLVVSKLLRALWSYSDFGINRPPAIPPAWWLIDQRATGIAIRELTLLALFAVFVRFRGLRLVDLGFRRPGTATAWLFALAVLVLGLASHPFVRTGPYELTGYTVYAALAIGIPVAFFEECVYRGFAVTTLQSAGLRAPVQVAFSGFIFGVVHISYIGADWTVPLFTGVLGCVWSWIYIKGGNSLWPTLVAHAINDAVLMPYFYLHGVY
jgi:hypothetical protein